MSDTLQFVADTKEQTLTIMSREQFIADDIDQLCQRSKLNTIATTLKEQIEAKDSHIVAIANNVKALSERSLGTIEERLKEQISQSENRNQTIVDKVSALCKRSIVSEMPFESAKQKDD
jgi:hypothetical protein